MAGRDTRYTHRNWKDEMGNLVGALENVLAPAAEHMHQGLRSMGAGEKQLQASAQWVRNVSELTVSGKQILTSHGVRLDEVSRAQRAAGGVNEVAADKRYSGS